MFTVDGTSAGAYIWNVTEDAAASFKYNVLVYSNSSLIYGPHVLSMQVHGQGSPVVLFDRAVYT